MRNKRSLSARLVGGVLWTTVGRGLGIGGSVLAIMFLTRYLSPGDMGIYFLAASLITVASGIGQFGLGRVAIRRISESVAIAAPGTAEQIAFFVLKLGVAAALISAICLQTFVLPALGSIFSKSASLNSFSHQLSMWLLAIIVVAVVGQIFRGFQDNRRASLVGGTFVPVALALAYGLLLVSGTDASLAVVTAGSAIAAVIAALLSLFLLLPRLTVTGRPESYGWKKLTVDAAPFWVNSVMFLLLDQADIWILSMYRSTEEVAVYGALKRLLIFSAIPVILILPVIGPMISDLYAKKDLDTLGRALRAAGLVGAIPLLLIILVLAVAPGFWLELIYGAAYRSGSTALLILCAGYLLSVPFGISSTALSMTDRQHAITAITLVTGATSLLASLYAAERYGIVGIAVVFSATIFLQRSLCWLVLYRSHRVRSDLLALTPQQMRTIARQGLRAVKLGKQ